MLQKEGFHTKGTEEVFGSQLSPRIVLQNVYHVNVPLKVKNEMKDAI